MSRALPTSIVDGVTDFTASSVMDNFNMLNGRLPITKEITFHVSGVLSVSSSVLNGYILGQYAELDSVYAQVITAPAGSGINLAVYKNTSAFATLVSIASATRSIQTSFGAEANRLYSNTDSLRLDITQVGSSTPGTELAVIFRFKMWGSNDVGV